MFRKRVDCLAAEVSAGPDAVKEDRESVQVGVSVTVPGMPFRCSLSEIQVKASAQLEEHSLVLQQSHSSEK